MSDGGSATERSALIRGHSFALWFAVGGGIVLWLTHLSASAALAPYACQTGRIWTIHAASVALLIPTAVAAWLGYRFWLRDEEPVRFLGGMAAIVNLANILAILAEWAPVFLIDPCAV